MVVGHIMKSKGIEKVLVTGGAGFVGSHIVDLLVGKDYDVTILDSFVEQVHGNHNKQDGYVNPEAHVISGSTFDRPLVERILPEVDAVVHLAAAVGIGQSMYQIGRYVEANTAGTATLFDVLVVS